MSLNINSNPKSTSNTTPITNLRPPAFSSLKSARRGPTVGGPGLQGELLFNREVGASSASSVGSASSVAPSGLSPEVKSQIRVSLLAAANNLLKVDEDGLMEARRSGISKLMSKSMAARNWINSAVENLNTNQQLPTEKEIQGQIDNLIAAQKGVGSQNETQRQQIDHALGRLRLVLGTLNGKISDIAGRNAALAKADQIAALREINTFAPQIPGLKNFLTPIIRDFEILDRRPTTQDLNVIAWVVDDPLKKEGCSFNGVHKQLREMWQLSTAIEKEIKKLIVFNEKIGEQAAEALKQQLNAHTESEYSTLGEKAMGLVAIKSALTFITTDFSANNKLPIPDIGPAASGLDRSMLRSVRDLDSLLFSDPNPGIEGESHIPPADFLSNEDRAALENFMKALFRQAMGHLPETE